MNRKYTWTKKNAASSSLNVDAESLPCSCAKAIALTREAHSCLDHTYVFVSNQSCLASMPPKSSHADAWLNTVESRIGGTSSSTTRMRFKRARDELNTPSMFLRTAGRRRQESLQEASMERRVRRDRHQAIKNSQKLVHHCLRLRAIVKTRLMVCSDCRRLMRVAHAVRSLGGNRRAVLLVLLVDRALRQPALSQALIRGFQKFVITESDPVMAAWKAFCQVRRLKAALKLNSQFWKGPAKFHSVDFIRSLNAVSLMDVLSRMPIEEDKLDATAATNVLSELPYVSRYGAFSLVRILPACFGVTLTESAAPAKQMSDGVGLLESFVSLHTGIRMSAKASRCVIREVGPGDAALILCESAKAMVVLGVLPSSTAQWTEEILRTCLASKATTALVKSLSKLKPLTDDKIFSISGARCQETKLVNKSMPPTRCVWDRAPHFCHGSEQLTSLVCNEMRKAGWMDPCFGADVFDDPRWCNALTCLIVCCSAWRHPGAACLYPIAKFAS